MWEQALTSAISKSSTWDLAIAFIAWLMYKLAMRPEKKDENVTIRDDAIRYMFYLGAGNLIVRVSITLITYIF